MERVGHGRCFGSVLGLALIDLVSTLRERDIQLVDLGNRDGDTIQLDLFGEQVEAPSLFEGFLQQDRKVPNLERQPGALFVAIPVLVMFQPSDSRLTLDDLFSHSLAANRSR